MNRRSFLMGAAAALVAAPAVADPVHPLLRQMAAELTTPQPWEGWCLYFGTDNGMMSVVRIHDEKIYVEALEEFTMAEPRYRWRPEYREVALWWGTEGK